MLVWLRGGAERLLGVGPEATRSERSLLPVSVRNGSAPVSVKKITPTDI